MSDATNWERAEIDLSARRAIYRGDEAVVVAEEGAEFWRWYASVLQPRKTISLHLLNGVPAYSASAKDKLFALWYSGGIESSYTLNRIAHLNPVLLRIEDFPVFSGTDRAYGQIHFICAVVAASLGYRVTYLGVERNDLLLTADQRHRGFIERSPEFIQRWNDYVPKHQLHSVCQDMHKEDVLKALVAEGGEITGTCDEYKDGRWCGCCFKCFEAFYTAKSVGIDLGIRLNATSCAQYYDELSRYISSGFTENFNNAYQHFIRLQMTYHLVIDPAVDCSQ